MFQIRQLIQLRHQGHSKRAIALSLALSRNTVDHYLSVVEGHFTDLQEVLNWQDDQLHRLFTQPLNPQADRLGDLYQRFPAYEQQLARTGVTRTQLWAAYKSDNPNGFQYTQSCQRYKQWRATQQTTMHLEHKAGEKLFVDFAGKRLTITAQPSGEEKAVEVFVAVLDGPILMI